eukprot:3941855-Rhodomonas_salina.2
MRGICLAGLAGTKGKSSPGRGVTGQRATRLCNEGALATWLISDPSHTEFRNFNFPDAIWKTVLGLAEN